MAQQRLFRDWVQNRFAPLILIVSSPEAEEICSRSKLSVSDLLQPFVVTHPNGELRA